MILYTPKLYKTNVGASQQAPATVRFLLSPYYKEDMSISSAPGCVGELQCDQIYLESGGEGCHARYQCEAFAWAQYGPGGRCVPLPKEG